MIDIWGYRLALAPNEKCLRSTIKNSQSGCLIHDASYKQVIEVSGTYLSELIGTIIPNSYREFFLYNSATKKLICPIQTVVRDFGHNNVVGWFIFHPAAKQEVIEEFQRRNLTFQYRQLNIFELFGNRRNEKFTNALKIKSTQSFGHIREILCEDPRFSFPPSENDSSFAAESTIDHDKTIWSQDYCIEIFEKRKFEKEISDMKSEMIIPGTKTSPDSTDPLVPLLVLELEGCTTVLIPEHWGRIFWKSFIFTKARFSGLDQVSRIQQERGIPVFPYDFPGTMAYQGYIEAHASDLRTVFEKKPPAKRINYDKLNVASPFKPDFPDDCWIVPSSPFESLEDYCMANILDCSKAIIQGEVLLVDKGVPEYPAIIYDHQQDFIIGYVTSGFFSLTKGHGAGIASCYCSALHTSSFTNDQTFPIRIRNVNTTNYRVGAFRSISNKQ